MHLLWLNFYGSFNRSGSFVRSLIQLSVLPEERNDAGMEKKEKQDVRNAHQIKNSFVNAGSDKGSGLVSGSHSFRNHCPAHGTLGFGMVNEQQKNACNQ